MFSTVKTASGRGVWSPMSKSVSLLASPRAFVAGLNSEVYGIDCQMPSSYMALSNWLSEAVMRDIMKE